MIEKFIISISAEEIECDKMFLDIANDYIRMTKCFFDFFFTKKREGEKWIMNIFFEKERLEFEKYIMEKYKYNSKVTIYTDEKFVEAEDEYGEYGNYFLSEFYKISNKISINFLMENFSFYNKKLTACIDLLIISAHINYKSIKKGYLSYASHSNAFFTNWRNIEYIRDLFEKKYLKNKDFVIKRVKKLTIENELESDILEFINKFHELKNRVKDKIESGELELFEVLEGYDEGKENNYELFYRSEFHKAIRDNSQFRKYMNFDSDFLSSRLMNVFTYLLLRNLGLKNKDRYLLDYYIYRAVEDIWDLECVKEVKNFRLY